MAIVKVQNAGTVTDNTAVSLAFAGDVTAGNLVVALVTRYHSGGSALVVGDISKSGTCTLGSWTLEASLLDGDANVTGTAIYSAPVTGTGSCTIDFSKAGSAGWGLSLVEFSGVSSTREDTATGGGVSSAPPTTLTMATAAADSAAGAVFVGITGFACSNTETTSLSVGGDYTLLYEYEDSYNYIGVGSEYRIVTEATNDAADWGGISLTSAYARWAACLAVFPASGGTNGDVTAEGAAPASASAGIPSVAALMPASIHSTVTL